MLDRAWKARWGVPRLREIESMGNLGTSLPEFFRREDQESIRQAAK